MRRQTIAAGDLHRRAHQTISRGSTQSKQSKHIYNNRIIVIESYFWTMQAPQSVSPTSALNYPNETERGPTRRLGHCWLREHIKCSDWKDGLQYCVKESLRAVETCAKRTDFRQHFLWPPTRTYIPLVCEGLYADGLWFVRSVPRHVRRRQRITAAHQDQQDTRIVALCQKDAAAQRRRRE